MRIKQQKRKLQAKTPNEHIYKTPQQNPWKTESNGTLTRLFITIKRDSYKGCKDSSTSVNQ
jgi:hypothetical protein